MGGLLPSLVDGSMGATRRGCQGRWRRALVRRNKAPTEPRPSYPLLVLKRLNGVDAGGAPPGPGDGKGDHCREERRRHHVWKRIEHIAPGHRRDATPQDAGHRGPAKSATDEADDDGT